MNKSVMIQPIAFLPRLSWLHRAVKSDVLIVLDAVRLGNNHENRTPIKWDGASYWLVVPLMKRDGLIMSVRINGEENWQAKILAKIQDAYAEAPFFVELYPSLVDRLCMRSEWLLDYDVGLLRWLFEFLDVKTPIVMQSELGEFRAKQTDLLVELTKCVDGSVCHHEYVQGVTLDMQRFIDAGVGLRLHAWKVSEYAQLGEGFLPNLSVIDALFNVGVEQTQKLLEIR